MKRRRRADTVPPSKYVAKKKRILGTSASHTVSPVNSKVSKSASDDKTKLPVKKVAKSASDDKTKLPVKKVAKSASDDKTKLPVKISKSASDDKTNLHVVKTNRDVDNFNVDNWLKWVQSAEFKMEVAKRIASSQVF